MKEFVNKNLLFFYLRADVFLRVWKLSADGEKGVAAASGKRKQYKGRKSRAIMKDKGTERKSVQIC